MTTHKISPHLAALFAMFLFLTASSAAYLIIENNKPAINQKPTTSPINSQVENLQSTTTIQTPSNLTIQQFNNSPTVPHPEPEFINPIVLKVNDEEYKAEWQENMTVYSLMNSLTLSSQKPFIFKAKEYPGMGMFVEEINTIKNDPQNNTYWIYYINGQSAKVGISGYFIQKGDIINWKYANTIL